MHQAFQLFDDNVWPLPDERPQDQTCDDYIVNHDSATAHMIEAMVGGRSIGQMSDTIPPKKAMRLWLEFENMFSPSRQYYIAMCLSDTDNAFQYGVAIVDNKKAGLLWIVESD